MKNKDKPRILYLTYLGLLEPIPKSQVLPYLFALSRDFNIHLLSFEKKSLMIAQAQQLGRLASVLGEHGIAWHRLTYHKYPLILSSLWDILYGFACSVIIIMRWRLHIVHARANVPVAIGYLLKLLFPIRLIYDRRGVMGDDHIEHSGWKKGGILYRISVWFEKKAINRSDAVVVLTHRAYLEVSKLIHKQKKKVIKTIPCCVDLQLFNCNYNKYLKNKLGLSGRIIFVYSGSVGTYNLLDEMFDFFASVSLLIQDAHFLILTHNMETINEFIKNKPDIDKSKITVSFVPLDKLSEYLSIADAGLLFRRISSTAVNASPTKFGEYLASGVPVVSGPGIGDVEEVISSYQVGVVLSSYGEPAYKQAVDELGQLLKEKDQLRKRCREAAEEIFSLNKGVESYADIYRDLSMQL